MHQQTIAEMSRALAAGEISSVELTRELTRGLLARLQRPELAGNSFISITADAALAEAEAADRARAAGEAGPLTGVPIAHKDIFCTNDVRTSCGSRMLDDFVAPYDATVVTRMRAAGCVMVGKTNMDEFAMGSSNETSWYGPVENPWDRTRVPGGSSGGSAAAVAARLVPGAGGESLGSHARARRLLGWLGRGRRRPARAGGDRHGHGRLDPPAGRALRHHRPEADLRPRVALRHGRLRLEPRPGRPDGPHGRGLRADAGRYGGVRSARLDQHRPRGRRLHRRRARRLARRAAHRPAAGVLRRGHGRGRARRRRGRRRTAARPGCRDRRDQPAAQRISLPHSDLSIPAYYVIAPAEASSNLARYDGVRFGHRCADPRDVLDLYERSRSEGFGDEVKRRIMVGTYALSAGYYDAYYLKAQKIRQLISADFSAAFDRVDLILGPTSPTTAFRIGERTDDPVAMYLSDVHTIAANLAGLPALSMPAGFADGLPVGVQLIGDHFAEGRLLGAAHAFQQATDHHLRAPAGIDD